MSDAPRSPWRFMPLGVIAALLAVAAVNGVMVYDAVTTFPGEAAGNPFDMSNNYDKVLRAAAREQALGWQVAVRLADGRPVVRVQDKDGRPLAGLDVQAEAKRPLGSEEQLALRFSTGADGSYVAQQALPASGQWDIAVRASGTVDAQVHATRRVVAP